LIPDIEKCLPVAIFKMAATIPQKFNMVTARNFSMSGINSGHHNLPTYEMSLKSDNVEFVRYCGFVAAILKMATARNFSMSGIYSGHHNLPTNEMSLKSNNVEFVAVILKMATDFNNISYVGRL
jgi:5-carboxymethyl-2-hydroxymuconate isomerase